jgi:hypothetical protein
MFGLGIVRILIEVALVIYIPGLFFLLFINYLKGKSMDLTKRGIKRILLGGLLVVLYLKLNTFYFSEGGIEYRRIPLKHPLEIKETEIGTYLMLDGLPFSNKGFINDCDIAGFKMDKDILYFSCHSSSDSVFSYNILTEELKGVSPTQQIRLESFDKRFVLYHFIKMDAFLVLIVSLIVGSFCLVKFKQQKARTENNSGI